MNLKRFEKSGSIIDHDTVSIKMYLHDINKYPLLSAEEQLELLREVRKGGKSGEKARQKLIECNLRIVIMVATQYRQKFLDLSDLISEGNIGLIQAIDRYDDSLGCPFINYAVCWIRKTIIMAIYEKEEPVFVPWSRDDLKNYFNLSSLDEPVEDEGDITVGDTIASDSITDARMLNDDRAKDIRRVLSGVLRKKELEFVLKRFGIGVPERTRAELAEEYHTDELQIENAYENILRRLRSSGITPDMLY